MISTSIHLRQTRKTRKTRSSSKHKRRFDIIHHNLMISGTIEVEIGVSISERCVMMMMMTIYEFYRLQMYILGHTLCTIAILLSNLDSYRTLLLYPILVDYQRCYRWNHWLRMWGCRLGFSERGPVKRYTDGQDRGGGRNSRGWRVCYLFMLSGIKPITILYNLMSISQVLYITRRCR